METKKYLYAAVGAPVTVAKSTQERLDGLRSRLTENAQSTWKDVQRQIDDWANEGEELMSKLTDGRTIDELTQKMDLEQVQEQVTKLRDQLEDLLDTWRANFRPTDQAPTKSPEKDVGKKPVGASSASTKPTSSKPATKPTTTKSSSTKASGSKSTAAKSTSTKSASSKSASSKSGSSPKASSSKTSSSATKASDGKQKAS